MTTKINNDISTYSCIEKALKAQEEFIYIKKNNSTFEVFPFTNLFSAICDVGDTSLHELGLPSELITPVDMNIEVPSITYVDDDSIAYYSPIGGDTKEQVLSIIKLFNKLLYINIIIYTSNEIYEYVSYFGNQNITFCCYSNPNDISIEASKIITYGYSARYFIQQKIPTIIIGPNGFGGWVTPDNISYLFKENFRGRPGGRLNEFLPHEIFVDEIMEIKENRHLDHILNENELIIDNYLKGFFIKNINSVITDTKLLHEYLISPTRRMFLKPKLVSNVNIFREGDEIICVQRKIVNDVLFSLPESDFDFLEDLKNDLTCKELRDKHEVTTEEFWEMMIPLWELKAIFFSL
jgi:hypothetical protein